MHCGSYGKAKIVLKSNQYFIEANDRATLDTLMSFSFIAEGIEQAHKDMEEARRIEEEKRKNI